MFYYVVRVIGVYMDTFLLLCALNWGILCSYVNYVDQGLSAFLKSVFFGGILSDVNYEYLLMKLREIIDRNGFEVGWYFWNFKNFFKNIFFQKSVLFLGLEVISWCMGGFGEFDVFLGLGFDIGGLCFV